VGFNWGYTCNFAHDDVVQFNNIHDLGQGITEDMGGVYYLSGINTGNKVLNNKVYNIEQTPGTYGAWGLYTDAGAAGVLFQNNLVYRTTDASLHVNSWSSPPPTPQPPVSFINNILAYGAMGAVDRHNDTSFNSMVFERNVFYYDKASIQYGYWYCEGKTICTPYFQFNDNLYYNKNIVGGQPANPFFKTPKWNANGGQQPTPITWMTFSQWQAQGEDTQSIFANPMFVNPTPGVDNFTLQANSPAFSIGFVAFDPSQAGRLPGATLVAPANAPAYPLLTMALTSF
jgi:hypothetical protein